MKKDFFEKVVLPNVNSAVEYKDGWKIIKEHDAAGEDFYIYVKEIAGILIIIHNAIFDHSFVVKYEYETQTIDVVCLAKMPPKDATDWFNSQIDDLVSKIEVERTIIEISKDEKIWSKYNDLWKIAIVGSTSHYMREILVHTDIVRVMAIEIEGATAVFAIKDDEIHNLFFSDNAENAMEKFDRRHGMYMMNINSIQA